MDKGCVLHEVKTKFLCLIQMIVGLLIFMIKEVVVGQVFSEYFHFLLPITYLQYSILIFILEPSLGNIKRNNFVSDIGESSKG
jgi:hypothetical protein